MGSKHKNAREIRKLTNQKVVETGHNVLPTMGTHAIERHYMSGKELKEYSAWTPGTNQFEGKTLDDAMQYLYNLPVQVGVNHARRIKNAFKENGMEGVNQYFEKVHQAMSKKQQYESETHVVQLNEPVITEDVVEEKAESEKPQMSIWQKLFQLIKRLFH